jgi:RNA polymerase sigma factor (sigma-70 family)
MSVQSIEALQRYLRRLCDEAGPLEDAVLLDRFVTANDHEAFELLIARHGPLVLGTARRLVANTHDAEDVFQAVFLSLARLAKSIRQGRALPAWLHRTTCRVAARLRASRLAPAAPPPERYEHCDPAAGLVWREVSQALDEELQGLPQRLRSPLLLCYLSGLSRDEAARQLGWSLGTLKRRLEEGRNALRSRLARRGIASVGLALTVLTPEALQAAPGRSLLESTLSLIFSKGAVVPATVSTLIVSSATTLKGVAVKAMLPLLAVIALAVAVYAGMGQTDPSKQADRKKDRARPAQEARVAQQDDPLPAGSTLRFGTSRFRHGWHVKALSVSADGKMAFTANDNDVPRVFDLTSGRVLHTLGNQGSVEVGVITPDGQTIVVQQMHDLLVCDAATGRVLRTMKAPRTNPWSNGMLALTPDGKTIAVTPQGNSIHLVDFESGKTIRTFTIENPESSLPAGFSHVLGIAFSPDGKLMASGGYDNDHGNEFARLWDVETGKELRRFPHGKPCYGIRSLAFSPDGKTLATLGENSGSVLRLFDVVSGKERRAFPKDGDVRTSRGCVAFAPDGKTVAAACASIRLYNTTTGEERLRIDRKASDLHFTDEGKSLTAAVNGAIYRWDTTTGKTQTPEAGDSGIDLILVSADGSRVVTRGQDGDAHIWDGTTAKHLRRFQPSWQRGMAISPDGRFLAWPVDDYNVTFAVPEIPDLRFYGTRIRFYDIAADKSVDRIPTFKGAAQDLAFTKDGKKLITAEGSGGMVRIWNVETAEEERSFQVVTDALKKKSFHVGSARLSPDGKTVVVVYVEATDRLGALRDPRHEVRLWDVATGKELPQLKGGFPVERAFSPDGRFVVTAGGNHVCEVASGDRVAALPDEMYIRAAAFSSDSRFLATTAPGDAIQIWEVATWTKRNEYKGHRDQPTTLTFAPNGQLLSGSRDTTVLAWDTRPPRVAASVTLESAWNDLAKQESAESFKSEGRLLAAPADAVKLLAEQMKPVKALDPRRVEHLLADLGSDEFAVREAASKALAGLDEQATPYLEETLKSTDSPEVRVRVRRLLEQRRRAAIPIEQIRQIRAVMVLERIGDGEAKDLLKRWAGGPAGARLTMEAAAASKRLEAMTKGRVQE